MTPSFITEPPATLTHRHVTSSVSTNSELIDALKSGALNTNEAHLLTAETQTAGRGQHTRSWQSPPGNVYLSLYHPIAMPISGLLSLIVGVELAKMPVIQALNKALKAQGHVPIGVKWANDLGFYSPQNQDLYFDRHDTQVIAFHKLAGILIEPVWLLGKLAGVVIGVGLNVAATPQLTAQTLEGMSYAAISLQDIHKTLTQNLDTDELVVLPTLEILYQQISHSLLAAIDCFEGLMREKLDAIKPASSAQASPTSISAQFMQQFNSMDALAGHKMRVTQDHNSTADSIEGVACGIDTNGCLQLRQDNGSISAIFTGRIDVMNAAK